MIKNVFRDLGDFFRRQSAAPNVAAPVAVVLIAGVVINLNVVFVLPSIMGTISGQSENIARVVTLLGVIGSTLGIFVLWFIYAGSFYVISGYFDGEGRFRTLFLLTGWGFLPLILQGAFGAAMFKYTLQHVAVPQDPSKLEPFMQGLRSRPPILISSLTRILCLVWQALLWTFAVYYSRDLTIRESIATVSIPVIVTLVINVNSIVSSFS